MSKKQFECEICGKKFDKKIALIGHMRTHDTEQQFGKGLDIGTVFIYSAQKSKGKTVYRSQRDAFFDLEFNDFFQNILDNSEVEQLREEDRTYIIGEGAIKLANIFDRKLRRPLQTGVLSPDEKDAFPVVEKITEEVLGDPRKEGEVVRYSLPGESEDIDLNLLYHQKVMEKILRKLGYTPQPINEAKAVVLSQLSSNNFTGLGLSFGGGLVNVALCYKSVPVFSFSVGKGGDWIDKQVAQVVDEIPSKVTAFKEQQLDLNGDTTSRMEDALSVYYDALIEEVIRKMVGKIRDNKPSQLEAVPIVIAGGTAMPSGFKEKFEDQLDRKEFPLEIEKVELVSQPLYAVVKGALVAAITDESKQGQQ